MSVYVFSDDVQKIAADLIGSVDRHDHLPATSNDPAATAWTRIDVS